VALIDASRALAPFDTGTKPAVAVTRGGIVESEHFVRHALAESDGTIVSSVGDIDGPTFMRSSAKPLIGAVVVRSGAADRFGLTDEELAVAVGSHSGEPHHIAAVRRILAKIGLDENALACGPHPPLHEPSAKALVAQGVEPGRIHNNCSGKHAAILALAVHRGASPRGYLAVHHPAQDEILDGCAQLLDVARSSIAIGVDGCGIPVIGVPLRAAAVCYARFGDAARFGTEWKRSVERVVHAMISYPQYVAGTGRFDTDLMSAANGAIASKGGAEGFHATAALNRAAGLAVKVADGSYRAVSPFVLETLDQHGILAAAQLEALARHRRPKIKNHAGTVVGEIVAL
jgi:L-asparaginase II